MRGEAGATLPDRGPPEPAASASPVEAAVREAFAQALGFAEVSGDADLFQLGGDSLTATKLAAWARRRFAVPVEAVDVIRARTAAACARLLEERMFEDDTDRAYRVVRNDEDRYSVWPTSHPLPPGWHATGPVGSKAECLAVIDRVWTDLRPAPVRERAPSRWLSRRRAVTDPACRVYCFPHSGGAAGEFLRWSDVLPQLEVWGVNLPGRGPRLDEPSLRSMPELAAAVVQEVSFAAPYALFGHSFGALLAYHVAQQLRERGDPAPVTLVLSSYPPPDAPRVMPAMSDLPDDTLLDTLDQAYGGVPAALRDDPEVATLVLPAYRADLAILEAYQDPRLPPLACPLLVVSGDADPLGGEELAGWARHTTAGCERHRLPGGHFYFRDQAEPLLALLRDRLGAPS